MRGAAWLCVCAWLGAAQGCIQLLGGWQEASLQERARRAAVVFRGLASARGADSALFWLIDVYKGGDAIARMLRIEAGSGGVLNLRDRRVNVTGLRDPGQCYPNVTPQHHYVVFADKRDGNLVARDDGLSGAIAEWTPTAEHTVWTALGWDKWSEWSACSTSCGGGMQERKRDCRIDAECPGYNTEQRRCNLFKCEGAVDPLSLDDRRYFHPARGQWERVAGRPGAWALRPNSYIWVPSSELFPDTRRFPQQFALLITLRLHKQGHAQGTVFSLRSRRQQDAYLSLELWGPSTVRLVHAGPNGTQAVDIPAALGDGHWHQLALGLHDDSSVKSYLDCEWISTDILKRNSLDTPEDADIVIGYLFMGDLEQLVIVPTPVAVEQQCQKGSVPLVDAKTRERRTKGRKGAPPPDDVAHEGSGSDSDNEMQYEVEWSEWSACSVSCGTGEQSRFSRCVDDGSRLELCMEAGGERTETRACSRPPCNATLQRKECGCVNGGVCQGKRRACHCPPGYEGRRCERPVCAQPCLNGGVCARPDVCSCPENYTGLTCRNPICDPPCRYGGVCVKPGECDCPESTSGDFCQNFTCRHPCVNGGACVGPDQCECGHGWRGATCAVPECDPPCENAATCAAGNRCLCHAASEGLRCEKRKCEYRAVQEPYTKGFRRLIPRRHDAPCDNCIQYRTVYKTFYKTVYKCVN